MDWLSDEWAAAENARLGFQQDQEENRTLWIAVQNFLKNQRP
jgi:hypothetical protein